MPPLVFRIHQLKLYNGAKKKQVRNSVTEGRDIRVLHYCSVRISSIFISQKTVHVKMILDILHKVSFKLLLSNVIL